MDIVLGQSLMVITSTSVLLYAKMSPLYTVTQEWLCCCLQVNNIVYKYFIRLLHIGSSNPIYVQKFRPVPLMVFEIF